MKTTIPKLRRIIRNVIKESAVGIDDYEKLFKARRAQRSAPNFNPSNKDVEDAIFDMGCEAIDEVLGQFPRDGGEPDRMEFIRAWRESSYPDCWWGNTFIVENLVSMALEKGFSPSNPLTEDRYQLARRITERLRGEYAEESDFMKLDLFNIANEAANTY